MSLVLPSTLETLSWISKKEAEDSKPAIPLQPDTLSKGGKKTETSPTLATDRVQLPPSASSKDSGITFDLKAIADGFAEFYNMVSASAESQTTDFSNLITLDQSINAASMTTASQAIDAQKNEITQAANLQQQQAQEAKVADVLKWVMYGVMIASVAVLVVSAVFTFGATLAAAPEVIAGEAALTTGAEVGLEGGGEAVELTTMSTAEVGSEAGTGAAVGTVGTGVDLGVDSVEMADMGMEGVADAGAESTSGATSQSASVIMKKIAQTLANKVFKLLLGVASGAVTSADLGYKSYVGFKNSASMNKVADSQVAVGNAVAMMKYTSQISQYFQNVTQRVSDTLTNTSKMLNVAPEIFGQILQTLQQVTEQASQAAIKG